MKESGPPQSSRQEEDVHGLLLVAEDVLAPAVGVNAGEITPGHLLKDVSNVEGFKKGQISRLQTVLLPDLLQEPRPREGPLVRTDRDKERRETVLADSIQQIQMLPLPVRCREGLLLKGCVGTAARGP